MDYSLTISNKKVYDFYKAHKNLNFESMNILFVDILDNLLQNANPSLNTDLANMLINNMKSLQTQVNTMENTMNKTQSEIGNTFTLKFLDFKREYMDDMKMILSNESR